MIRSSGTAKAVALTLAILAHGAFAVGLTTTDPTEIEGAGTTADVRLGSAFKDLAAGTLQAQATTARSTPRTTPDKIEAQRPEPARAQTTPAPATATKPQVSAPETPDGTLSAAPVKPAPVPQAQPTTQAARPQPDQTTPDTPAQRIEGTEPQTPAVTRSLRPKTRSAAFEAAHETRPEPKPVPKRQAPKTANKPKAKPAEQGNANRNARAGEATGKAKATARQSGSGGGQKSTGNAAASNYPGLVMRKLSRAGKPRVNARGAAVVAFSIGGNGRLASVSLARSSGSSSLDRAALRLVQRAGPFPKPPRGAQRRFSIQIKGR